MIINKGKLDGILIIEPRVFADSRGFFYESYNAGKFKEAGIFPDFVQDNHSRSIKNTLRGLHYQVNPGQDKLVRATVGEVWDVVVDIRRNSPTFGQWESFRLSAENKLMLFVPKGFAHGFCVLSDWAEFQYKCSDYWSPADERAIIWNDSDLGIKWPIAEPILSGRDGKSPPFREAELF